MLDVYVEKIRRRKWGRENGKDVHRPRKYEFCLFLTHTHTHTQRHTFVQCFRRNRQRAKEERLVEKSNISACSPHAFLLSVKSDTKVSFCQYRHWAYSVPCTFYTSSWSARCGCGEIEIDVEANEEEKRAPRWWLNAFFPVWGWTLAENMIRIDTIRRSHHHSLFVPYLL